MNYTYLLSILVLILNISFLNAEISKKKVNKTRFKTKGKNLGNPDKFIKTILLDLKKKNRFNDGCWLTSDIRKVFQEIQFLEDAYIPDINKYKLVVQSTSVDKKIKAIFETMGPENQVVTHAVGEIPAGLNFGGHSIVEIADSFNIFYGMKLRNNTKFIINKFTSDWDNMTVSISLSLNDIYLVGDYDRSLFDYRNGSLLFKPSGGKAQLLIEGADYDLEGRYRFSAGKLVIEHAISKIMTKEVQLLMDKETKWTKLDSNKTDDLITRLQVDFETWLKEYFNFHLGSLDLQYVARYHEYEKSKELFLNQYMDYVMKKINKRLNVFNLDTVKIPAYEMILPPTTEFHLVQGFVEGLDTMYRQSITTAKRESNETLTTNAYVAFSNLKVYYKYEIIDHLEMPPQKSDGTLILQADDLTAHFQMKLIKKPGKADIRISSIKQTQNAVLVEGSPEKYTTSIKHLLKQNVYALMSKVLTQAVLSINTMPKCYPVDVKNGKRKEEILQI